MNGFERVCDECWCCITFPLFKEEILGVNLLIVDWDKVSGSSPVAAALAIEMSPPERLKNDWLSCKKKSKVIPIGPKIFNSACFGTTSKKNPCL